MLNIYQHSPLTYIGLPPPELTQEPRLTSKIFIHDTN